jgi:predicted YcjX-like family ATPase
VNLNRTEESLIREKYNKLCERKCLNTFKRKLLRFDQYIVLKDRLSGISDSASREQEHKDSLLTIFVQV